MCVCLHMLMRDASLKQRIPCIIRISIFGAFSAEKKCTLYTGKYGNINNVKLTRSFRKWSHHDNNHPFFTNAVAVILAFTTKKNTWSWGTRNLWKMINAKKINNFHSWIFTWKFISYCNEISDVHVIKILSTESHKRIAKSVI